VKKQDEILRKLDDNSEEIDHLKKMNEELKSRLSLVEEDIVRTEKYLRWTCSDIHRTVFYCGGSDTEGATRSRDRFD
jgi:predicted choloylglycine hydrolase